MKNFMKAIAVVISTTLIFTACSENNELNNGSVIEENSSADFGAEGNTGSSSDGSEESESVSEPVEETNSSADFSAVSSVESKPAESSSSASSSSSLAESKSAESSSSSAKQSSSTASSTTSSSKPANSSSSSKPSSSTSSTKPVEQPTHTHTFTKATCTTPATCTGCGVTQGTALGHNYKNGKCTTCGKADPDYVAPHNCATDGHVWEVTYTTTEPKWCREMHIVYDYGFDYTLAQRFLNTSENVYYIYKDTLEDMGLSGVCGGATIYVEVWGTETYETRICKICGSGEHYNTPTITPLGEWRYIDGVNPRWPSGYKDANFDTLFYDPYNIPQVVIDNIRIATGR